MPEVLTCYPIFMFKHYMGRSVYRRKLRLFDARDESPLPGPNSTPPSRDYYQTEWPRRTRAYEYGVYTDQVLQNFFMPGMYVLTNLSDV
jgi:hypothetical protein